MELFIIARFHAKQGLEPDVEAALRAVLAPSRSEPGCREIHAYRSTRDAQLFYIYSRWDDEAAFDAHADLPHTVAFEKRIGTLIDHPLDVTRAALID